MANCERLLPVFIRWETGCARRPGESLNEYFVRARDYNLMKNGGVLKGDSGGFTVVGITHKTYEGYLKRHGTNVPEKYAHTLMRIMTLDIWLKVFHEVCWDKIGGDKIACQSVANTVADWAWISGPGILKRVQRLVGVSADGVVGLKTIAAINGMDGHKLFVAIQADRKAHIDGIIKANPGNAKFRNGWMNRVNSYVYEG